VAKPGMRSGGIGGVAKIHRVSKAVAPGRDGGGTALAAADLDAPTRRKATDGFRRALKAWFYWFLAASLLRNGARLVGERGGWPYLWQKSR